LAHSLFWKEQSLFWLLFSKESFGERLVNRSFEKSNKKSDRSMALKRAKKSDERKRD